MKIKKRMITAGIMTILCLASMPNNANAAGLQANGGEPANKSLEGWLTGVRQMQAAGGALGLTDTINFDASNYDSTKAETCDLIGSNTNLDIHMEKNTEYGAMAILSASSYGNPNPIADKETTTGNKTGVVMKINGEWVAAGTGNTNATYMYNATKRYWNDYGTAAYITSNREGWLTKVPKSGDAVDDELLNWHGSTDMCWFSTGFQWGVTNHDTTEGLIFCGLRRGTTTSIFEYNGRGAYWTNNWAAQYANFGQEAPTRAVVVVGSGI